MKDSFFLAILLFSIVFISGCVANGATQPDFSDSSPIRVSQLNQLFATNGQVPIVDGNGVLVYYDLNSIVYDLNGLRCFGSQWLGADGVCHSFSDFGDSNVTWTDANATYWKQTDLNKWIDQNLQSTSRVTKFFDLNVTNRLAVNADANVFTYLTVGKGKLMQNGLVNGDLNVDQNIYASRIKVTDFNFMGNAFIDYNGTDYILSDGT